MSEGDSLNPYPVIMPSLYEAVTDPLDDEEQYSTNPNDNPLEQMGLQADGHDNFRGEMSQDEFHSSEDIHTHIGNAVDEQEYAHDPIRKRIPTAGIALGAPRGTNIIARPTAQVASTVRKDARTRTTILYNPATTDPLSGNAPGTAWIGFTRDTAGAGMGGFPLPAGTTVSLDYAGALAILGDPSGSATVVYVIRLMDEI